ASEYAVVAILCIAVFAYGQKRDRFDPGFWRILILSIVFTQIAELAFTLYIDVYGIMNWVGHYLKLLSFGLLYFGMVQNSLQKPYDTLFRDLDHSMKREQARVKQLEEMNRNLEAFSSSLSHDIRSPLQVIRSYAELIATSCIAKEDDRCDEYVKGLLERIEHIDQLVESLLRLASISVQSPNVQRVNLSEMAEDIIAHLKMQNPQREVSVEVEDGIYAVADPTLAHILLSNLISNAWKYTRPKESAHIEFGTTEQSGRDVFYVRDNGVGFNMDDAERLFEPFQRLHDVDAFEGAGIGLVTAKKVVDAHRGDIWFESEEGVGTTAYFTLGNVSAGIS
ncbi:hypothetical protein EU546_01790, partial [Candidatus Thorarchaeota archaeon]